MSKKSKNIEEEIEVQETQEAVEAEVITSNKILPYIFKTNLKIGNLIHKTWEIIYLSPCEAKEFKNFVYSYSPRSENCGC